MVSVASRRFGPAFALIPALGLVLMGASTGASQKEKSEKDKPSLTLKASPMMTFSPAKVVLTAELKGGANDYQDYYCPTIEWDWDDGTRSESAADCDPYEAGKSEIKRRYTVQHQFNSAGTYKVAIRLKKKDKALIAANVTVQVRAGVRDPGGR
jgi:hypothetical protein